MWKGISDFIFKNKWILLAIVAVTTALMAVQAGKTSLSYSFTSGIPASNPVSQNFEKLHRLFGDDASNMVLAFTAEQFYSPDFILSLKSFESKLRSIEGVENVTSILNTSNLVASNQDDEKKLVSVPFFSDSTSLDSSKSAVLKSKFYEGLLVNPEIDAYLLLLSLDSVHANSELRNTLMQGISETSADFGEAEGTDVHISGLPYIRTTMAQMVQSEMQYFLVLSLIVTSIILILLFRSAGLWLISLVYIGVGIIWGLGIMGALGFKITLLTALLAPLVVIISVPNTIYFINKYHSSYLETHDKRASLRAMIERIGIVTLFTNLTTALGFGVFALTTSQVLHEFGIVAGLTIVVLFILAIILLPIFLSFLPAPKKHQLKYMENNWSRRLFDRIGKLILFYRKAFYGVVAVTLLISVIGILRLNTVSYIVDDIPHDSKLYSDLVFFEKNFGGVMPLEIIIDTRKEGKATSLGTLNKMNRLSGYVSDFPFVSRPLSVAEGIKFARQAYYDGEPSGYGMPNSLDISFFAPYLSGGVSGGSTVFQNFVDSTRRYSRVSFRMQDIGTHRMDSFLSAIGQEMYKVFDSSKYDVFYSGTSVTFLEGSKYIISSLQSSVLLAFLFIFGCIFYLFRNWRMLLIAIVVNLIPLIITAGIMGWAGIRIKPSTVLVFSIALGITVDMTIRFLVNFKYELEENPDIELRTAVLKTISEAGVSIIFTTFILAFGFGVFVLSSFDGTRALGILIPLTIINAMISNLTLLPALMLEINKKRLGKMLMKNSILKN